jgi:4-hydroxy-4-methyl-2-oxoglutarate aldolase
VDQHRIVRTIPRPDPAMIDRLAEHGVATVHEAMGRRGLLGPEIRPIQRGVRVAGPAVTVRCQAGDNLMIHAAVEVVRPGDVLVVTTTSRSTDGMFGELLATSLRTAGCRAVILDAGVRDVAELNDMAFPVWARAVHAQGTVKATPGSVNVPVVCADAVVEPGEGGGGGAPGGGGAAGRRRGGRPGPGAGADLHAGRRPPPGGEGRAGAVGGPCAESPGRDRGDGSVTSASVARRGA